MKTSQQNISESEFYPLLASLTDFQKTIEVDAECESKFAFTDIEEELEVSGFVIVVSALVKTEVEEDLNVGYSNEYHSLESLGFTVYNEDDNEIELSKTESVVIKAVVLNSIDLA